MMMMNGNLVIPSCGSDLVLYDTCMYTRTRVPPSVRLGFLNSILLAAGSLWIELSAREIIRGGLCSWAGNNLGK